MNLDADQIVEVADVIKDLRDTGFSVEAVYADTYDWLDLLCYHEEQRGTSLVVNFDLTAPGELKVGTYANPHNTRGGPAPEPGVEALREYLAWFRRG